MVSVTSPEEAVEAVKGGANIIDVKNPVEGALGANLPWITAKVRDAVERDIEVSGTLGDLPYLPGTVSLAALGAALCRVNYVKIGLLGPKSEEEVLNILRAVSQTFKEFGLNIKVVAAGYADYVEQGSLNPLMLPMLAAEAGVWGVLIDVRGKDERGLFDHLSYGDLKKFVKESHLFGLNAALAGSLGSKDAQTMIDLDVDVIGVRRGVCTFRNDRLQVDRRLVEELVMKVGSRSF